MAAPAERADVLEERKHLYEYYTMPMSGKNRDALKKEAVYLADPDSRYKRFWDKALPDFATQAREDIAQREADRRSVREERPKLERSGSSSVADFVKLLSSASESALMATPERSESVSTRSTSDSCTRTNSVSSCGSAAEVSITKARADRMSRSSSRSRWYSHGSPSR
jgi:hypothetical protein